MKISTFQVDFLVKFQFDWNKIIDFCNWLFLDFLSLPVLYVINVLKFSKTFLPRKPIIVLRSSRLNFSLVFDKNSLKRTYMGCPASFGQPSVRPSGTFFSSPAKKEKKVTTVPSTRLFFVLRKAWQALHLFNKKRAEIRLLIVRTR